MFHFWFVCFAANTNIPLISTLKKSDRDSPIFLNILIHFTNLILHMGEEIK